MGERLVRLADQLEDSGIDSGELRELQTELNAIQAPEGFIGRMSRTAKDTAVRHWRHLVGEVEESTEMVRLLRRRVIDDDQLSDEEREHVRAQLFDLVKVVPASLIASINWMMPVPGTTFFTPWLLTRLGLMPSRWREAHLLHQLRTEHDRLVAEGHVEAADRIEALQHKIEEEADAREWAAKQARLLHAWDADDDGVWDDEERAAYDAEVDRLRTKAITHGAQRRWYLLGGEQVFGPVVLSRFVNVEAALPLLVCFDGQTAWVSLNDILHEADPLGHQP